MQSAHTNIRRLGTADTRPFVTLVINAGRWLAFEIRRCEGCPQRRPGVRAHRGDGGGEIRRECDAVPL
jgi:hypothetical protein